MEAFVKELLKHLEAGLSAIDPESNPIKGYDKAVELARHCITTLKKHLLSHPIEDETSQIYYFKHIVPVIYSPCIYYIKLHDMELHRITSIPEKFSVYLTKELKEVSEFLETNGDLHRYYYSGQQSHDRHYFTNRLAEMRDEISIVIDSSLCPNSYLLSKILAYEKYRGILKTELEGPPPEALKAVAEWKGKKADAVELIISLHAANALHINGKPATIAQIKEQFSKFASVDLKDFNTIDNSNRARKKAETPFLSQLSTYYINRKGRLL